MAPCSVPTLCTHSIQKMDYRLQISQKDKIHFATQDRSTPARWLALSKPTLTSLWSSAYRSPEEATRFGPVAPSSLDQRPPHDFACNLRKTRQVSATTSRRLSPPVSDYDPSSSLTPAYRHFYRASCGTSQCARNLTLRMGC